MTAMPPDPNPTQVPGLEPGGGVPPGSTPPDSAQTSGLSAEQPRPKRILTPLVLTSIIAVIVFVLLFVAVAMWMLAHLP
ncbi:MULTISPECIES: DUF6480 family protein [Mycobacterium]|uniref:DUF6480 family protein n=1 Tax=Mycobacterium TaxID=1763 RepID=UPI0009EAB274|nr:MULTISPECIES: DUF6480 family protein [Mycobacterium]MDP7727220.1 DUF6480 family protein [Mycobacterium sp. TY813]